ncbi:MAG TPA: hypothetical protein VJ801_12690, partial [Polyangia bacterium]|nr:hypothetical protein [Polyangia bacterium]
GRQFRGTSSFLGGQFCLHVGHTFFDLGAVGSVGRNGQETLVQGHRLFEISELPVALGYVVEESRVGLGQVGGLELVERLAILADLVQSRSFGRMRLGGIDVVLCRCGSHAAESRPQKRQNRDQRIAAWSHEGTISPPGPHG